MKVWFSSREQKNFLDYFAARPWISEVELTFYERTYKYVAYIKWIPWIRMVAIWNSISMNAAKESSDIDLFIVTTNNSLWFVRILITFIFSFLWVRKTDKKHAWRFCLSFFATEDWLNFDNWKIWNDIYLYFWIAYLKPILNYNNTYDFFIKENEAWANFSNYKDLLKYNKGFIKFKKENKRKTGFIIWILNKIFKFLFLPKTFKHYEKIWKPYWIIINDNLLKFHNNDIRKKVVDDLLS